MAITTYKGYRISTTLLGAFWITNIFGSEAPGVPLSGVTTTPAQNGEDGAIKAAYDFIDEREKTKRLAWPGEDGAVERDFQTTDETKPA